MSDDWPGTPVEAATAPPASGGWPGTPVEQPSADGIAKGNAVSGEAPVKSTADLFLENLPKYPAHFVEGLLDFLKTPGTAYSKGVTPEQEIGFGLNAALGTIGGGEAFRLPKGVDTALAPVVKAFDDGVMRPAAEKAAATALEPIVVTPEGTPEPQVPNLLRTIEEAKNFGVIGPEAPETVDLAAMAAKDKDTPAEAAFRAHPVGSDVTPENMRGTFGHAPGEYDTRGKEWIDKIDAPDSARDAIEGLAKQYDYFPEARAGTASPQARAAVAEAAGIDPAEIESSHFNTNFDSDGKVRAVIQALRQTTQDFTAASEKMRLNPTDENAAAALEAQEKQRYVLEYTMGARAESGRSLNAWKDLLQETERANATPKLKAGEATGEVPVGTSDLINAAHDVQTNIAKPDAKGGLGLQKLVDAAERLVNAPPKPGVPQAKLPPDLANLVDNARKALESLKAKPGEKGAEELAAFRKHLTDLSEGNGSIDRTTDAAQKLIEATKKEKPVVEAGKGAKEPSARGKLMGMAKRLIDAKEGTAKAAPGAESPKLKALSDITRVAVGYLKEGRVRSEIQGFRDALDQFKTSGNGADVAVKAKSLLDALGDTKTNKEIEPRALVEVDKIAAAARSFIADSGKAAKELLPPDLKDLIDNSKSALSELKKNEKTELEKTIAAAEKQAMNMVKQKAVRKPIEALPIELQNLVDKAGRVTKRFGGVAKGEEAAMLLARSGRTAAEQAELARQVEGLTPNQVARVLKRLRDNPDPHWLFWGVQQGLISGLITHTKYAFVNTASTFMDRVIAPEMAAIAGKLRGEDKSLLAPIRAGVELFRAIPDAFEGTKQAFKTGTRVPLESELRLAARGEANPEAAGAIVPYGNSQGPNFGIWRRVFNDDQLASAAKVIGIPGRSANSIHTFFKIINERAAGGARAFEAAELEGNKIGSDKFWERYQNHLDNPTDDALRANVEDAYSGTFMEKLGEQSQAFAHLVRNTPFKWLIMFTHIPLNMIRRGIEYSPLAALNLLGETKMGSAIKGELGPHVQNLAFSKMTVGASVGAYFIHKALSGQATGDYPLDPKERRRWDTERIQPNSIQVDGQWISLERLGPQAMVARIAANYAAVIEHYDGSDDGALMKASLSMVLGTANALASDVGFETVKNIVNVMENRAEAKRFAAYQLSSYAMPISFVTQAASAMDPYMRQADSLLAGLKYHLPGLRETLLPKRDPLYGEPVHNPDYGSVLREGPVSNDPVKGELARLNYWPTAPGKTIGGVKLTPEQYDRYEATAGPLVKQMLQAAISKPGFQQASLSQQTATVKGTIEFGRAKARQAMLVSDPTIAQQGLAAARAKAGAR